MSQAKFYCTHKGEPEYTPLISHNGIEEIEIGRLCLACGTTQRIYKTALHEAAQDHLADTLNRVFP